MGLVVLGGVLLQPALGAAAVGLAAAATVAACVAATRRPSPMSYGWWWVAAAVTAWTAAHLLAAGPANIDPTIGSPAIGSSPMGTPTNAGPGSGGPVVTIAVICLVAFVVAALVAAWVLTGRDRPIREFARHLVDGLIMGVSVLFVTWGYLLGALTGTAVADPWQVTGLSLPPAADALLAGTLLGIVLGRPGPGRRAWQLMTIGLVVLTAADATALIGAPAPPGVLLTAGWMAALLFAALSALTPPGTGSPTGRRGRTRSPDLLPYGAVSVAVVAAAIGDVLDHPALIVAGAVLALLMAVRQVLVGAVTGARESALRESLERRGAELGGMRSRMRQAFDDSLLGLIRIDLSGCVLDANPAVCRLLGRSRGDLIGTRVVAVTVADDVPIVKDMLERLGSGQGSVGPIEVRYRAPGGQPVWAQQTAVVFRDADRNALYVTVQIVDVTDARTSARAHADQARFLDAVLEGLDSAVIACDAQGRMTLINRCARELFGMPAAPWLPPDNWLELYPLLGPDGHTPIAVDQLPLFRALRGETVRDAELCTPGSGRERKVLQANSRQFADADGAILGAVVVMTDITERRRAEKALIRQALHDPLTDLANRALLGDRLLQAIARQDRQPDPFALLLLDLDGFKLVNDSLGHQAGDQVLIAIAHRLQGCLRASDTVARLGGDEFAVLLENTTGVEAVSVAEQLLGVLRRPVQVQRHTINPDASIGIALSTGLDTAESMLRNADLAMYAAKDAGKGMIEVFRAAMHDRVLQRLIMDAELRQALDEQQFAVYYQPTFSLVTGRLCGFEALLRWRHPNNGEIPPCSFIPLAEATGLIVPLGRWVLREACRQAARWRKLVGPTDHLLMSVNLSVRQLQDPGLLETVVAALADAGLEPEGLQLEITESIFDQRNQIIGVLGELHRAGVKLAIDDFGTGYSSLSRLHILPIDRVKVDRSFVDLLADGNPSPLVAATISMAHSLGMQTTAEGIESADQLPLLRLYGCDDGQGYHFGRPMTAKAATAVVRTHRVGSRWGHPSG